MQKEVTTGEVLGLYQIPEAIKQINAKRAEGGRDAIVMSPKFVYALNKNIGKCSDQFTAYVKAAQELNSANPDAEPEALVKLEEVELAELRDDTTDLDIHMIDIDLVPAELAYHVGQLDLMIKE